MVAHDWEFNSAGEPTKPPDGLPKEDVSSSEIGNMFFVQQVENVVVKDFWKLRRRMSCSLYGDVQFLSFNRQMHRGYKKPKTNHWSFVIGSATR